MVFFRLHWGQCQLCIQNQVWAQLESQSHMQNVLNQVRFSTLEQILDQINCDVPLYVKNMIAVVSFIFKNHFNIPINSGKLSQINQDYQKSSFSISCQIYLLIPMLQVNGNKAKQQLSYRQLSTSAPLTYNGPQLFTIKHPGGECPSVLPITGFHHVSSFGRSCFASVNALVALTNLSAVHPNQVLINGVNVAHKSNQYYSSYFYSCSHLRLHFPSFSLLVKQQDAPDQTTHVLNRNFMKDLKATGATYEESSLPNCNFSIIIAIALCKLCVDR